ncbi:MAG: aminoglycoside phosphotransferase family protein [Chloroflexi bacterium]|nr:aminoglycoside phosphotransferase family protein [Chloroflexota bacterium]
MKHDLTAVIEHFGFDGDFLQAVSWESGHINDTYVARFRKADATIHSYILQRINHNVFKNPRAVMQNVERVTAHLKKKIIAAGGDPERETLNLVSTMNGKTFCKTDTGDYWRAYVFIKGARTYEVAESLDHVYSAAKAFGQFQKLLGDFPAEQLYETIPNFHHTGKRFKALVAAVEQDAKNRAQSVRAEIEFAEKRAGETSVLVDLLECGKLPNRVTHNDTKFNNVMIDNETGKGICIIDLDTVMPGLSLYDFGDAVRSGANSADEDEPDLSKVCIDLDVFDRFASGYLDAARDFLTSTEVANLSFSAKLMTLECGMRFLTDHLNGDVYFKIHRENHNLDRCRTQFKMVRDIEIKFEQMEGIVARYR